MKINNLISLKSADIKTWILTFLLDAVLEKRKFVSCHQTNMGKVFDIRLQNANFEVDFFIPEQKLAIQVAYSVLASENINTQERELAGLDKLCKRFPDIKLLIITFDEEGQVESKKGNKVEILPAWKFLLS